MTPLTVGIIMDGNGRWAENHKHAALYGHVKGGQTASDISQAAFNRGCGHVALWAGSKSNFDKRLTEMFGVVSIVEKTLRRHRKTGEEGRLRVCGNWRARLNNPRFEALVDEAQETTRPCKARNLWVLLDYDAKSDDRQARMAMYRDGVEPTDEELQSRLWTAELPNLDLLIRTACRKLPDEDMSVSNDSDGFLWHHRQDTVIVSTSIFWPDFKVAHLDRAFDIYHSQPRRKGGKVERIVSVAAE